MPEQPSISLQILHTLAQNGKVMTFEDLSAKLETLKQNRSENADPASKKRKQSLILESLIELHDRGLVFLNPETDDSSITEAGLEKFKSLNWS